MLTIILGVLVLAITMLAVKLTSMSAEIDDLRERLANVQRRMILDIEDRDPQP